MALASAELWEGLQGGGRVCGEITWQDRKQDSREEAGSSSL